MMASVDHLVIDIGKVLTELNLVASVLEISSQCIESYERSCITEMEIVIDRRTASIHLNVSFSDGFELFLVSCERVEKLH